MEKLNLDKIDDWLERFSAYALVQEIQHDVKEANKEAFHRALLTTLACATGPRRAEWDKAVG